MGESPALPESELPSGDEFKFNRRLTFEWVYVRLSRQYRKNLQPRIRRTLYTAAAQQRGLSKYT